MKEYKNATLIGHIRDCIAKIRDYTTGGRDEFMKDRKTQDAVYRNLEIIGEAVKNLTTDFRAANPGVEWAEAAGLRDVLIHDYADIDPEVIWTTIERDLPKFVKALQSIRFSE